VVESAPGRGNVVVRYPGSGELEPFLIYGHTDVVTAEPEHWTHGPFSGDLTDGCVWGRGALDMKGLVAQEVMVMLLLKRSGIRLKRDVIFAATADEESGGQAGMGFVVDHHPDLVRAEYGLSEGGEPPCISRANRSTISAPPRRVPAGSRCEPMETPVMARYRAANGGEPAGRGRDQAGHDAPAIPSHGNLWQLLRC
jgi:acetylornithine deacetylase/succinyl-diaminopimelate desuccinylase-like protein